MRSDGGGMSEVQRCLSVFAVASGANHCRSISMADAAIDVYLKPHLREGTAKPALQSLLRAFGDMRKDSAVAYAIRTDLEGRLSRLAEPAAREQNRQSER